MKILISRSSINQVVGGAELSARDITRALTQLGYQPLLVTNIKKPVISKGLPSETIASPPSLGFNKGPLKKLIKPIDIAVQYIWYAVTILKFRPDIISPQSRNDQVILTHLGRLFKKPVIWRDPGDLRPQLEYKVRGFWQKLNRRAQVRAIRKASHIFTLNSDDRRTILKLVPNLSPEKISVIGSNILFEDYTVKPSRAKRPLTIGSVSRLDKHKGVQYLLAAFKTLQKENHNSLRLVVAGDGNYRQELEYQAKNIPDVEFIGNTNDVSEVFNQIDIFVQPSEFEGWGRTVREAMFFGLPIVGSRVGGIKKQITHNETGLLFRSKYARGLLIELRKLVESKSLRNELGKNAKQKAEIEGDWVATVRNEMVPLFEKYSSRPNVRVEVSSFINKSNYSGVGYYSKMLTDSLGAEYKTDRITGPYKRFSLGNKVYNKLASYGLALPVDLFMKPVDLTILPNFAYWPTVKSKQTAVVVHDLTYIYFPELVEKKNLAYLRRVVPRAVKKADFIITVSEAVKNELVKEFDIDESKIAVTHIPADKRFKKVKKVDIHTKYKLPTKKFIFFVGNMEPRKNLVRLIKAYLQLKPQLRANYSLVLGGGKGWNSNEVESLLHEAKVSGENIIHAGYIDDGDLASFYSQASLFVMPSLYEGFGMPILESLEAGTPVVAADIPVLKETGGNAVIYANPKSIKDIAAKISHTLTDKRTKRNLSRRAKTHLKKFSWQKNVDTIVARCKR